SKALLAMCRARRAVDERHSLVGDLSRFVNKHRLCEQDIVFFHTASAKTLHSIASALCQIGTARCPVFHARLLYAEDVSPEGGGVSLQDAFLRLKNTQLLNKKVFVHAETDALQANLQKIGFSEVLLIPPVVLPLPPGTATHKDKGHGPITLLYLGEAREEKGFHLLPDLV